MNLLNKFGEGNLTEELLDKAEEYLWVYVLLWKINKYL